MAVGLLLVLVVGGLWLVFFSSTLAVEEVQVQGEQTISEDDVRAAAAVPVGEPLARVDLTAITARVQALAVVRSATVTRHWPDGVTIAIVERTPVAVVDVSGQIRGMDAEGVLFRDYQRPPADLPMVQTSTETRADALREAAEVVTALPDDLAARVDHVDVVTVDQISLVLRDGRTVEWGSADESELKAEVLVPLLQHEGRALRRERPGAADHRVTAGTALHAPPEMSGIRATPGVSAAFARPVLPSVLRIARLT